MSINCAIIIPTIDYNKDLEKCISYCNKLNKVNVKIYVVSDVKIKKKIKNTVFKTFGPINMSEKRNLAVKLTTCKYISFLDDDTYPTKNWLINGIEILKKNKEIGVVSGPDFHFLNQKVFIN